jgi:hypothetical protein
MPEANDSGSGGSTALALRESIKEYEALENQLAELTGRKKQLRERIKSELETLGTTAWSTTVGAHHYSIRVSGSKKVSYDERRLQEILGARYRDVLKPDATRINRNLDQLRGVLEPFLEIVGKPSDQLIARAVNAGVLTSENLESAVRAVKPPTLFVTRKKLDDGSTAITQATPDK